MSENNNEKNKDVAPAKLQDGESLIHYELVEKYNEAVKESKLKLADKTSEDDNVISSTKIKPSLSSSIISDDNSVIGSGSADRKDIVTEKVKKNTVAVHSTRNVTWSGVGKVDRGYNIVTKEASEKWLTREHIRLATPEEVARDFGK
jgi:hypothetical protein